MTVATRADGSGVCLTDLFAAAVARVPNATAVVAGERRLSFAELDAASDRLAGSLARRGVGPESVVALLFDKDPEALVALWGVLKAGAAYLPLDVRTPAERVAVLCGLSGAAILLAERSRLPVLGAGGGASGTAAVAVEDMLLDDAGEEAARKPRADNLALVIYTSGSTGRPKGVMLTHRVLVHAHSSWCRAFAIDGATDCHAQVTSFSFAVFHADVVRAHCAGGTLVLCPTEVVLSPPRLYALIEGERVRFAELVPAVLRELLRHLETTGEKLAAPRWVVVGSDRWYVRDHLSLAACCGPRTRPVHSFGLTETGIDNAYFDGDASTRQRHRLTPIGRPFHGVRLHVADARLRELAAGEQGDLLVGGDGLARGYLRDPRRTAERFLPDPFGNEPGARIFLTGDRVRRGEDELLELLGRGDAQLKIRGFRVEPGEVEAALEDHLGVRSAAVEPWERQPGEVGLAAWIVPAAAGEAPEADELKRFIGRRLPDYMVPSAFVFLDRLPLTASGKVDRRALPPPPGEQAATPFVAPRNPVEGVVAALWSEVLGIDRISVEDDFFALGGHSLAAGRIATRLVDAYGVEVTLRSFFENPTVARLAAHLEEERGRPAEAATSPGSTGRDRRLPLSFAQQRIWFFDRLRPGNPAYNVLLPVPIHAHLDAFALRRAVREIVRRHEALRTVFPEADGHPYVQIVAEPRFGWSRSDCARDPDPRPAAWRLAAAEERRPFDLGAGPLIRARLVRLGRREHLLLVTMHHIVCDGWSLRVFLDELQLLYDAFCRGEPSPLAELLVQYADYAVWQRQWLQGEILERQLETWRRRLSGAPVLLQLPTDRPRPAVQSYRGGRLRTTASQEVARGVEDLCRRTRTTPFMVLLATFALLLVRLSGGGEVVVGTPTANRRRRVVEGLIGFFANTLALRIEVDRGATGLGLLERVKERVLEANEHQDLPFERLVEELAPPRSLGHHPVFQVMLSFDRPLASEPGGPDDGSGRRPSPSAVAAGDAVYGVGAAMPGGAKFDLALSLAGAGAELTADWDFSSDLFDRTTVQRFAASFWTLLGGLVAEPHLPCDALPLLSPDEQHRLVVESNDSALAYRDAPVHRLFAEQASRTPEAVALVHGEERWTYRRLLDAVHRLSRHLRAAGVAGETPVGVCLPRGPGMVTCLLAILEAGGYYVPLDPAYPRDRLAYLLDDAAARLVVTTSDLAANLPQRPRRLCLDQEARGIARRPARAPGAEVHPGQLAVIIYTSGSTGRPKGVALCHRGIAALTAWSPAILPDEHLSGVLAVSSICFDLSLVEIFVTLARGGRVILLRDALEMATSPAAAEGRFVATFPSIATELLRLGGVPASLRVMNLGGELFGSSLVDRVYSETSVRWVHNMYGPSEDTVYSTWAPLPAGSDEAPSIGRTTGHSRVWLLDRGLRPVSVGVTGQLFLGGHGLARGYLGRPGLTASLFLPSPFGGRGERMYRSGDLARFLADGRLQFVGRGDDQVKVRGFRIELGEVESVLRRHPAVAEVAVVAREDRPGEKILVAYVGNDGASEIAAEELLELARRELPRFMVPSVFVHLARFPHTATGKVDRNRLPQPDAERLTVSGFVAPRDPREEALAGLWAKVLGLGRVGIHDDFFDLGGHSLLVTRLLSRIGETFGTELPVEAVFAAPTVAELAARLPLPAAPEDGRVRTPRPIPRVRRDRDLPASFAQQRLWVLDQMQPGLAVYHLSVAVELPAGALPRVVSDVVEEILRRHEALRTTFSAVNGRPMQRIGPVRRPEIAVIDERTPPPQAARLIEACLEAPFDLETGPLARALLWRRREAASRLLVGLHHIVADGWSLAVLRDEVQALYAAFAAGDPSPLPPLSVQYADYSEWDRRRLSAEVLEAELAYWRSRLDGLPALLELPADRPRPPRQDVRGALFGATLPAAVRQLLSSFARAEGATLFMALASAFCVLIQHLTGRRDVAFGTPVARRNHPDLEPLIGFFVNTLVLRMDLSDRPDARALVGRVRRGALDAFGHADLPFERLVEELAPPRSSGFQPVVQVVFALQNLMRESGQAPAAELRRPQPCSAKFDLTLAVQEQGQGQGLVAWWEYRTALFDHTTVERWSRHFESLLIAMLENSAKPVTELSVLSPGERHQVTCEWCTGAPAASSGFVHDLVARRAATIPDHVALEADGRSLSYGALERCAHRLAVRLQRRGVRPEVRVGIIARPDLELVVALLAVLRAGGVAVPLDAELPPARLEWMIRDADVKLLLVDAEEPAVSVAGRPTLSLKGVAEEVAFAPDGALDGGLDPRHLAYLIFTSGTTGRPKAVMNEHAGLFNTVLGELATFGTESRHRVLQLASFSFDASLFEIFLSLAAGATLCLAPRERLLPGLSLERELVRRAIDVLIITPSALAALASLDERIPATVIAVGEALPRELAAAWAGRCRLYNAYGPTEASIWASIGRPDGRRRPPIGRPVPGARLHVLDRDLRPLPVGVAGEVWIGGAGVGRGYLGRPARTADAWRPDPFADRPGRRMYATGDLGRWLPDGELELLGRRDRQVKLRGLRVELGEIEAALAALATVRAATVIVRDDVAAQPTIVAYVVAADGAEEPQALRRSLKEDLPDYMIPSLFVFLDELPRTSAGKLDRERLPRPDAPPAAGGRLPDGPVGEMVAGMWQQVLEVAAASAEDDFFASGGHSLLAARLVGLLREALGVDLSLAAFFADPTPGGLVREIDSLLAAGRLRDREEDVPAARRLRSAPLSYGQERLWLVERLHPGQGSYTLSVSLDLSPPVDPNLLQRALGRLVERHQVLRTAFEASRTGGAQQRTLEHVEPPLVQLDLAGLAPAVRQLRLRQAAAALRGTPFDLAAPPLFRVLLARLSADAQRLVLVMHHIVSDGWSVGIFVHELERIHAALTQGHEPDLPDLPFQYRDYAAWQRRRWADGGELIEHWRRRLQDAPRQIDLPFARRRRHDRPLRGGQVAFGVDPELTAALGALAGRAGTTRFMVYLSALFALLYRYTGALRLPVLTDVANRSPRSTELLIGFFLNQIVLLGDLTNEPSFGELLARVRSTALDAYLHQELPFERLVEDLVREPVPGTPPLAQIKLVLENTDLRPPASRVRAANGAAAEVAQPAPDSGPEGAADGDLPAQLDLTLFLREESARVHGLLVYDRDLFTRAIAERVAHDYCAVIAEMVADLDAPAAGRGPWPVPGADAVDLPRRSLAGGAS
jgi:amino acid adenylation domain-containing protein